MVTGESSTGIPIAMVMSMDTVRIIAATVFLTVCGVQDYKRHTVSVRLVLCGGAAAVLTALTDLTDIAADPGAVLSLVQALIPGGILLALALAAGGAAGTGDGLCFLVLGALLGARGIWILLAASLMLISGAGIVLLLLGRAGRNTRMPFLTFSAAVWCLLLVFWLAGDLLSGTPGQ